MQDGKRGNGFRETKTVNQQNSNESVFLQSSKLKPPTRCFKNPTHSGISGCELFRIGPCLSCGDSTALFEQFITNERQLPRTCHTVVPKSFLQGFSSLQPVNFPKLREGTKMDMGDQLQNPSLTERPKSSNLAQTFRLRSYRINFNQLSKRNKNRYKNTRIHNCQ